MIKKIFSLAILSFLLLSCEDEKSNDAEAYCINYKTPAGRHHKGDFDIEVKAEDDNSVDSVFVLLNNDEVKALTAQPYKFTWKSSTVPDGEYTLSLYLTVDGSGNVGLSSEIKITVENQSKPVAKLFNEDHPNENLSKSMVIQVKDDVYFLGGHDETDNMNPTSFFINIIWYLSHGLA